MRRRFSPLLGALLLVSCLACSSAEDELREALLEYDRITLQHREDCSGMGRALNLWLDQEEAQLSELVEVIAEDPQEVASLGLSGTQQSREVLEARLQCSSHPEVERAGIRLVQILHPLEEPGDAQAWHRRHLDSLAPVEAKP